MAEQEYQRRLGGWRQRHAGHAARDRRLSNIRGLLALGAVVAGYFFFGYWLVLPVIAFIVLVVLHERNARRQQLAQRAIRYYETALGRLHGTEWHGKGNGGAAYRDAAHPYADDLDVFGAGGLFELLCAARTQPGERRLAEWLLTPARREEALLRQEALRDLAPRLDLREEIALFGEDIRPALDGAQLAAWGQAPAVTVFAGARWLMLVLSIASFVAFTGWLAQLWTLIWFFGVMLLILPLSFMLRAPLVRILDSLDARSQDLGLMAEVLGRLEREQFSSAKLVAIQRSLGPAAAGASLQIARLRQLIDWLESDRNAFFALPAFCMLWRPQWALAIERWRQASGPHLGAWVEALAEFEALASLAGFAYERDDLRYPELLAEGRAFEARALKHPLLPAGRAVANDVAFGESPRLLIVSGSNMSGKSTLMRAVGLNTLLAWAGAPVCAAGLRISPFALAASLRANDSLREGRSRFYAEIQRLRQVVDLAQGERPLLFLIDELLSGTNSHDRRLGAEAILKGLLARGAVGITTTHDLALTRIAGELPAPAVNVHLEDRMVDGRLEFDYQLRPGVVERSNALDLMRSIGLEV
jgi:hypothetical protein